MNIGMRMKVMPGARILTMVTKKFRRAHHRRDAEDQQADVVEVDIEAGCVVRVRVRLAYPNHPPLAVPPQIHPKFSEIAPKRKIQ